MYAKGLDNFENRHTPFLDFLDFKSSIIGEIVFANTHTFFFKSLQIILILIFLLSFYILFLLPFFVVWQKIKNAKQVEKLKREKNLRFSKLIIFVAFLGIFIYLAINFSVFKNLNLPLEIVKPQNFLLGVDIVTNNLFTDNLEKSKFEIIIVFYLL